MSYRSLIIEGHSTHQSADAQYTPRNGYDIVARLNAYTWKHSAADFARKNALPDRGPDNCWGRYPMNRTLLREFLELGAAADPDAAEMLNRLGSYEWYVVNEEEF